MMKIFSYLRAIIDRLDPEQRNLFRPSSEDIFLVSYPRSGNTWMRTLLTYLIFKINPDSLNNLKYYVPDIYYKIPINKMIKSEAYVVKSHEPYKITGRYGKLYKKSNISLPGPQRCMPVIF